MYRNHPSTYITVTLDKVARKIDIKESSERSRRNKSEQLSACKGREELLLDKQ
jgi:hypothetical protein